MEDIENGWSPACHKHPACDGNWGVLKVGAVSFGIFDPKENKELPADLQPKPQYEIAPGDFLMSRANTVHLVGACAIVRQTLPRLLLCDKIFRFRFAQDTDIAPAFLDHVLKSPALRHQIEAGATGTSPTMKNIAKAKIMKLLLPVPPLKDQRRVVAYLDGFQAKVDRLKTLQTQTAAELDALLPSILDKAFKGELVAPETIRVAAPGKATPAQPAIAKPRKHSKGIYFTRGAIATYVIDRMHKRPQFGRVMFEKCLYLAEAYVGIDLEGTYQRAAAGPLDAEYLHKLESLAAKQQWFTKRKSTGAATRYTYRPGRKAPERLTAAAEILGDQQERMDHLLDLMAKPKMDTERAEIVATLFAAWNDLLIARGEANASESEPRCEPTDDQIVAEVREHWHEAKQRFDADRLRRALNWMREQILIPGGIGSPTIRGKSK